MAARYVTAMSIRYSCRASVLELVCLMVVLARLMVVCCLAMIQCSSVCLLYYTRHSVTCLSSSAGTSTPSYWPYVPLCCLQPNHSLTQMHHFSFLQHIKWIQANQWTHSCFLPLVLNLCFGILLGHPNLKYVMSYFIIYIFFITFPPFLAIPLVCCNACNTAFDPVSVVHTFTTLSLHS